MFLLDIKTVEKGRFIDRVSDVYFDNRDLFKAININDFKEFVKSPVSFIIDELGLTVNEAIAKFTELSNKGEKFNKDLGDYVSNGLPKNIKDYFYKNETEPEQNIEQESVEEDNQTVQQTTQVSEQVTQVNQPVSEPINVEPQKVQTVTSPTQVVQQAVPQEQQTQYIQPIPVVGSPQLQQPITPPPVQVVQQAVPQETHHDKKKRKLFNGLRDGNRINIGPFEIENRESLAGFSENYIRSLEKILKGVR